MKKRIVLLLIGATFLLGSCSVHSGLTTNVNNHTTEVVLSKNNYKVVAAVQGTSKVTYVLGFGGVSKDALIARAKADMLAKADIVGGPRAIINETVEMKQSWWPFARTIRVVVSAHIIEFTE